MLCNEHFWNVLIFYEIIESIRRHKTLPHWVHSLTFGMGYWAGVVDDEINYGLPWNREVGADMGKRRGALRNLFGNCISYCPRGFGRGD